MAGGSRYAQVQDLRTFSKRAGSLDKEIRKALAKEARTIMKPTVMAVKRKVRSSPSHTRHKGPKLRSEIAKVVKSKGSASSAGFRAEIWVASKRMPSPRQNLPMLMEGAGRGRWRFPVFPKGKDPRDWTWSSQRPRPFFNPVVDRDGPEMLDTVHEAVAKAVRRHLQM